MYFSSRKGAAASTRKQTTFSRTTTRFEDGSPSGNETDGGSAELLDISTSREDLSRAPSRCSCHSGESNAMRNDTKDGTLHSSRSWSSTNLKTEFDNNAGSDDEMLKEELLRIFDRERHGLESYFKQKTENILQNYRRKQCEWEENLRLEKIEYEKTLAQEKIDVQQNYISEMTKLTKQFNHERDELESHYKKQIAELTLQFEARKTEMDETIVKERTELKQRLEMEYQSMLNAQKTVDEQMFQRQKFELEDEYKKRITELEQKLREASCESELSGRKMQSELDEKFEKERAVLVSEWRKRVELLEIELGKEKERANKEERRANEAHGFLRTEVAKKEIEIEKLRQTVETVRAEISKKEKSSKEFETLQQNIFLRGSDALPGKLREDFEKMLAAHRHELERAFRKDREGLEAERERRAVLEREALEKQSRVERERMALEMEKERDETKRAAREKEDSLREEMKREVERMKTMFEAEKETLREEVRNELSKERTEIGEKYLKEKNGRDGEVKQQLKSIVDSQDEERKKELERHEYELWVTNQKMEHTKQWVEGQYRVTEGESGGAEDNRGSDAKNRRGNVVSRDDSRRSDENGRNQESSNTQADKLVKVGYRSTVEEKNATNLTINVGSEKNSEYGLRALEQENEGLKTKVAALQENIKLHECYKGEASEEIERLRKTNRELKTKLGEMKEKVKEYEERLEDCEEKIAEYEKVCQDYEMYLQECREKILVIEKDRKVSTVVRVGEDDGRRSSYRGKSRDENEAGGEERSKGNGTRFGREDEDDRVETSKKKHKQRESQEDSMVDILRVEKEKLEYVVNDLESKIQLLEQKISEISLVSDKKDNEENVEQRMELSLRLDKSRRQNRNLVNKMKDLQFQLQGLVDKLRKEKKKVKILQTEYRSFMSMHQSEIKELREKLEHSGNVIARLQHASTESNAVGRLQEEISMIGKMVMEERLNDQRMIRARSVEEMETFRDLEREKGELGRKLQDVKVAMDGYSERLRNKVSYTNRAESQLSLNSNGYLQDGRLSKTLQALEKSQKTSLRQNERLLHEKKELQSLVGRLCRSQEDVRGSKMSLASCASSTSSSSSSSSSFVSPARAGALYSNRISSSFSVFD